MTIVSVRSELIRLSRVLARGPRKRIRCERYWCGGIVIRSGEVEGFASMLEPYGRRSFARVPWGCLSLVRATPLASAPQSSSPECGRRQSHPMITHMSVPRTSRRIWSTCWRFGEMPDMPVPSSVPLNSW